MTSQIQIRLYLLGLQHIIIKYEPIIKLNNPTNNIIAIIIYYYRYDKILDIIKYNIIVLELILNSIYENSKFILKIIYNMIFNT